MVVSDRVAINHLTAWIERQRPVVQCLKSVLWLVNPHTVDGDNI